MFTVLYYVLQAFKNNLIIFFRSKVHLENVWTSKQMITEGNAAIWLRRLGAPSVINNNQNKDQL